MSRWIVIAMMCLCVFAPAKAQDTDDDIPELDSLSIDNVIPIARFGWGVPYDVEFFPDNDRIAVATGAGITIYDHNLTEQRYIPTNEHAPRVIAVSPDGHLLASGGNDVRLWDVETGALIDIINTGYRVSGLAFNADGTLLAVSKYSEDSAGIFIFDTASGREQSHLISNQTFARIAFHPDGDHLIAQRIYDCCGTVVVIDINTNTIISPYLGEFGGFVITPSGDEVMLYEGYVGWHAHDLTEPEIMTELRSNVDIQMDYVQALSPIDENGLFSVLTVSGEFARLDSSTLSIIETGTIGFSSRISAISPNGQWVVAIDSEDSRLSVHDMRNGASWEQNYQTVSPSRPFALVGNHVFFVTTEEHIGYWNIWTDEFGEHDAGQGTINTLIAGDDGWVYSGGEEGSVLRWDAENVDSEPIVVYEQSGVSIRGLAQGAEDLFVLTCVENSGQLWRIDLNTGESLGFDDFSTSPATTVPSIEISNCFDMSTRMKDGDVAYTDGQTVYVLGDTVNSMARQLPLPTNEIYVSTYGDFLVARRAIFLWEPSARALANQLELVVSHTYEITAFSPLDEGLYVSAGCGFIFWDFWDLSRSCYGADMILMDTRSSYYGDRTQLIGHQDTVRQIIRHETLPVFVSLSEDGTIILWGAPLDPQPVRRGAGARLFG